MEKNINIEKLSAYIDGELSPEDKDKLEQEIALSSDLLEKTYRIKKVKTADCIGYKTFARISIF